LMTYRGAQLMPSFDIVSEVDIQEVRNAVDQANREIGTRFDFKGVEAEFEQNESEITLKAEQEFQLNQMMDILRQKLVKRSVDIAAMDIKDPQTNLNAARQTVLIKQGIETDVAKKMVKEIKASKLKVQAQIQGEQVRVTGKKRDDLQQVITLLRESDYGLPLQYQNFRD
jgi:cyclic-di-GMP-binding protein